MWVKTQQDLIDKMPINRRTNLHLGGDGRADSPGHSAKFLTYALMCLDSNKIVTLELVQVSMTFKIYRIK